MKCQIRLKPSAEKELEKIPKKDYYRVVSAFSTLSDNPYIGKKLKGEYGGHYSFRIWPYRIIYLIYKEKLIIIIRIGHRQGVYR